MPNFFMPAKDPSEVRDFFQPLVDAGKMMVLLANERPDVYDHVKPSEDVRLIVDREDHSPPEGVEFTRVLEEFRPDPIPEDQLKEWLHQVSASVTEPPDDVPGSVDESIPQDQKPEPSPDEPESLPQPEVVDTTVKDALVVEEPTERGRVWTPFSARGFKG